MSRKRSTEGAYTITGRGINTSSVSLGAAISKANTIGTRLQRELQPDDEVQSLYVRRLGEETSARIDVHPDVIETHSFTASR